MTEAPPVVPDHEVYPRVIAKGAYGQVHLARNVMGTWRAVKVIYRSNFESERPYEREFQAIRRFEPVSRSHPSQVAILQVGRDDVAGFFYYVMELADDASRGLDERSPPDQASASDPRSALREMDAEIETGVTDPSSYVPHTLALELKRRGRLAFEECLRIGLSLATALDHLHRHELVHRDVKPANIVFVNGMAKLADIGLVAGAGAQTMVGTEGYIPPEGPGEPPADVFGLGKVIYEMMTGLDRTEFPKLPSDFADWENHDRWLELNNVVLKAAANDSARRYPIAAQLHADLLNVQAGESPKWQRAQRRLKAFRAALWVTGIFAFFSVGVLIEQGRFAREERRGILMRDAQVLRLGMREQGWSDRALAGLAEAAKGRMDDDLRGQAVAVFAELDARFIGQRSDQPALHLAFDANGKALLMDGGVSQAVAWWEIETSRVVPLRSTNAGPVWLGPSGTPLQFTHLPGEGLAIVRLDNGELERRLLLPNPRWLGLPGVRHLTLSADASSCAAALADEAEPEVAVWETATGRLRAVWKRPSTALALSPAGDCLAVGSREGTVQIFSVPDEGEVASFQQERGEILALAFRRDLTRPEAGPSDHPWLLAAGDNGGKIFIYKLAGRKLKAICLGSPYVIRSLAFSPDGMLLASGGHREVRLWEATTGHLLSVVLWDNARALTFSADGRRLAMSRPRLGPDDQNRVGVIELIRDRGVIPLQGLSAQTVKLAFSPDGQRLAALAHNWEVGIWNLASNRMEMALSIPVGLSADNAALAFSSDGRLFAYATSGAADLWDVQTGRRQASWALPAGLQQWVFFDRTGRLLHFQWDSPGQGTVGRGRTRALLSDGMCETVAELPAQPGRIRNGVLSGDSQFIAVASDALVPGPGPRALALFNVMTGIQVPLPPHARRSEKISFAASGSSLAYLDPASNETIVYSLPDGRELWRWNGLLEALGKDARWYATGGWELRRSDRPGWSLKLESDGAARIAQFSPQGDKLALGTAEGTVLVYHLEQTIRALTRMGLGW